MSKRNFARNGKNPYQDYTKDKPCTVRIKAENAKYGNAILGFRKFGDTAWRFGHETEDLHPLTIITIAGIGKHELETKKVQEYLDLNDHRLRVLSGDGFGFFTESYVVPIHDLVYYCNGSQDFQHAS